MFEQAIRLKLRFDSPKGGLTMEDLWDTPLTNLDRIAVGLKKQLREAAETTSFLEGGKSADGTLQLKFDVAKHILDVRCKERKDEASARERSQKIQQLSEILQRKQNAELESKSPEEIQNIINSLR